LLRESNLARLLKRRVDGIFIAEYEQGDAMFYSGSPATWA
jgi:hypothetical protein